ncbi:MAG: nucleoside-triphosphatase [Bacteroidota bacterium]
MPGRKKNIFIVGLPGVGKTVLIRNVLGHLARTTTKGFYTEEIRKGGNRVGFSLKTVDGRLYTLAHVTDVVSRYRVGRYKVDLGTFERVVDEELKVHRDVTAYVVDEVGKMECLSPLFRRRLKEILESEADVIATIAAKGDEYIEAVKNRSDISVVHLTRQNRDEMLKEALRLCGVAESNSVVKR